MIRVLILDLGGTLVAGESALPHVPEALAALDELDGATGEPLDVVLVSDFHAAWHGPQALAACPSTGASPSPRRPG